MRCLSLFFILTYILQLRICQTNRLRVIWTVSIHYTISEVKITLKGCVLFCSVLHITSSPNLAVSWVMRLVYLQNNDDIHNNYSSNIVHAVNS